MNPSHNLTDIIWLHSTESTNKAVRERFEALDNLSVIASGKQTAGRGQGSNKWHSEPGKNLTFSVLYKPSGLRVSGILAITHATTLGIRDYLLEKGVRAGIKWPNDIWVDGKKICGILIENSIAGSSVIYSIIGVGFNLNQDSWPSDLPNPVSLRQLTGESYDLSPELRQLVSKIRRRLVIADSPGGRLCLQEEFGKYVFRLP